MAKGTDLSKKDPKATEEKKLKKDIVKSAGRSAKIAASAEAVGRAGASIRSSG